MSRSTPLSLSRRTVLAAPLATPFLQAQAPVARGPVKVVTMYQFTPEEVQQLVGAVPNAKIEITIAANRDEFHRLLPEAEVVYGEPRGPELDYAPKLKWIQTGAAGMEWMDDAFRKHPAVTTNMARVFAPGITETGMGMLLCLAHGITGLYMPQFYQHQMKPVGTVKSADHIELAGKTMGIVGMGGIGTYMARRAHNGFDMHVIATDAKPLPKPDFVDELHDPTYFPQMAARVDVLVSAAPHTPKTERMFNEQIFRSMKKGSYFIALSRGKLFDDMALVKALQEGWIAGAGLDVFPVEPPPPDHPIFTLKNVVMTAHTSGWSPDRQKRLIALFADNLRRYSAGQPLENVVDKVAGY